MKGDSSLKSSLEVSGSRAECKGLMRPVRSRHWPSFWVLAFLSQEEKEEEVSEGR